MSSIDRRSLFRAGAATLIATACRSSQDGASEAEPAARPVFPLGEPIALGVGITGLPSPELAELSAFDLGAKLARGELTSVDLVTRYRERIAALDGTLHAVLEINREAELIAGRLDAERAAGKV